MLNLINQYNGQNIFILQIYYCTVVKKRQRERARLAQEQAILQQQVIQQHWQQQQQQQQQQEQFGGGFAPAYQPSAQGYDSSNYSSIYWNPSTDPANPAGSRSGSDLPPAYSSVYSQGSPPPYPSNDKY